MEKAPLISLPPSIQLPGLIFCFFVRLFFNWVMINQRLLSSSKSFLQSKLDFFLIPRASTTEEAQDYQMAIKHQASNKSRDDGLISREDMETVMGRLGIFLNREEENSQEYLISSEFSEMFEQKEASLEEIEGAFCVFDENKDGFIDARELQRVLCLLGLKEGSKIEDCKKMIRTFDENGDGRIDFLEFVKFMEIN